MNTYLNNVLTAFEINDLESAKIPPRSIDGKCIFVLFQNRTGSNLLIDCLSQSPEINAHHEIFNADAIGNNVNKHNLQGMKDYIEHLSNDKIFLSKIGFSQFSSLHKLGILEAFTSKPKLLVVRRRNLARQAISLLIADKTKKWASFQEVDETPVEYEFQRICDVAKSFNNELMDLSLILGSLDLDYRDVYYEDLANNRAEVMHDVFQHTDVTSYAIDEAGLKFQKQANQVNEEHFRRFAQDYVSTRE